MKNLNVVAKCLIEGSSHHLGGLRDFEPFHSDENNRFHDVYRRSNLSTMINSMMKWLDFSMSHHPNVSMRQLNNDLMPQNQEHGAWGMGHGPRLVCHELSNGPEVYEIISLLLERRDSVFASPEERGLIALLWVCKWGANYLELWNDAIGCGCIDAVEGWGL